MAWNVTPSRPRQGQPASGGWIVFETTDGREKRRLLTCPDGWDEMPELDLHALLASAAAARPSKLTFEPGRVGDPPGVGPALSAGSSIMTATVPDRLAAAGTAESSASRLVRSFRYPNGRLWSVCVVRRPEGGGDPLLRFSAGARHLDLRDWPADWAEYADERLVALVRSVPRPSPAPPRTAATPRRRHDDPRE